THLKTGVPREAKERGRVSCPVRPAPRAWNPWFPWRPAWRLLGAAALSLDLFPSRGAPLREFGLSRNANCPSKVHASRLEASCPLHLSWSPTRARDPRRRPSHVLDHLSGL